MGCGASINETLMDAVKDDNSEVIARIVKKDPTAVDEKNELGYTALHQAAKYGKLDCIAVLLASGSDMTILSRVSHFNPMKMCDYV
mgnify:CR=1 FL=1